MRQRGSTRQKCRQGRNISLTGIKLRSNLFREECYQSFTDSWTISPQNAENISQIDAKKLWSYAARVSVCESENFPFLRCMQLSCLGGKYGKSVGVKVVGSPVDLASSIQRRLPWTLSLWPKLHSASRNLFRDYYVCLLECFVTFFSSWQHWQKKAESCNQTLYHYTYDQLLFDTNTDLFWTSLERSTFFLHQVRNLADWIVMVLIDVKYSNSSTWIQTYFVPGFDTTPLEW